MRAARRTVKSASKIDPEASRRSRRTTAEKIRHIASQTNKEYYRSLNPNGEHEGWHIPTNCWVIKKVGSSYYKFKMDALGYIDFDTPGVYAVGDQADGKLVPAGTAYQPMTYATPTPSVNIFHNTVGGTDYMVAPGGGAPQKLRQNNRSPHDAVANAIRGVAKPPGFTWHHHKTKGRMDLVETKIHAAFAHRGGFSLWGKA